MSSGARFANGSFVICGASSGLGLALTRLILAEGGTAVAAARRKSLPDSADEARLIRVQADLATERGVGELIEAVSCAGLEIDGLLINGAGPPPGAALGLVPEHWHQATDALIVRPLQLIHGLQSKFRSGASILFVTSSSVREPIDQLDLSNVLRPGVAALANVLSRQLAPEVRVNSIAPGRIRTTRLLDVDRRQAQSAGVDADEHGHAAQAQIPLRRYGDPTEFAEAAAFLLSRAASYITGATLQVDGGLLRGVG